MYLDNFISTAILAGKVRGWRSLIDGKDFLTAVDCRAHVAALVDTQDGDCVNLRLTLEQRQAIFRVGQ